MLLKKLKHIQFICIVLFSPFITYGAVRTWSGGTTGTVAWTGNWTGAADPTSADDVTITTGGTLVITGVPTVTINSLTIAGGGSFTVELQGATTTLTIGGNAGVDLTVNASTSLIASGTGQILNLTMDASATATITGTIQINSGSTFDSNGASVVSTIDGTLKNYGTVTCTTATKLVFSATGNYNHARDGGAIPTSTWSAGATCTISGYVNTRITGLNTTFNTFHHFIWNATGQTDDGTDTKNLAESGETITCNGNFTVSSTNSKTLEFSAVTSGATQTLNVGGNLVISGGKFRLNDFDATVDVNVTGDINISSGTLIGHAYHSDVTLRTTIDCVNLNLSGSGIFQVGGSNVNNTDNRPGPTLTITGNLATTGTSSFIGTNDENDPTINVTGTVITAAGTFFYASQALLGIPTFNIQGSVDLSAGTVAAANGYTSNAFQCVINLTGASSNNLTLPTGLTYNTNATWKWDIASGRTITLLSNVELGGTGSSCVFTNNGTLIMGTYIFTAVTTAVASFVNASGATLKTAHLSGLSTTAATGAVQITGTKTFSSAASYVFNGAAAQVTGNFGVSTTPTASTVLNLEFNNSSGVTLTAGLTVANTGTLTLTAGYHDLSTYTLQVGTSSTSTVTQTAGGLYSATNNGSFKRYIPAGAVASTGGANYGLFPFAKTAAKVAKYELNSTVSPTGAGFITGTPAFSGSLVDVTYTDDNAPVDYIVTTRSVVLVSTATGGTYTLKLTAATLGAGTASDLTLLTYTSSSIGHLGTYVANSGTAPAPVLSRTGVTDANISTAQTFVIGTYNQITTPLPIQLISFKGVQKGNDNELKWTTSSELNNDYFTIEKSLDGIIFEKVGTENGAGNSSQLLHYSLTDFNVRDNINYYRLVQTDFDGKSTTSNLISIDNRTLESSKEIVLKVNILGQEVNDTYRGLVVIIYSDGSSIKIVQ